MFHRARADALRMGGGFVIAAYGSKSSEYGVIGKTPSGRR
jgi:hypothetical protein